MNTYLFLYENKRDYRKNEKKQKEIPTEKRKKKKKKLKNGCQKKYLKG